VQEQAGASHWRENTPQGIRPRPRGELVLPPAQISRGLRPAGWAPPGTVPGFLVFPRFRGEATGQKLAGGVPRPDGPRSGNAAFPRVLGKAAPARRIAGRRGLAGGRWSSRVLRADRAAQIASCQAAMARQIQGPPPNSEARGTDDASDNQWPACSARLLPAPPGATGPGRFPADLQRDRRRGFSTLIIKPVTGTRYRLRWPAWRRAASAVLNPANTDGKPGNRERNDLRSGVTNVPHVRE